MSTLTKDANWLEQLSLQDVRKAHTQLERARRVMANPWTKAAGSPTQILTGFVHELVSNHVEIAQRAVAIKAQAHVNALQQKRHGHARAHARAVLEDAVSHRLLVRGKLDELKVEARAKEDIASYRMLSESIRALNLQSDTDFDEMYQEAYRNFIRQNRRDRQLPG